MIKTPVMILNHEGDRGKLKATILCERLVNAGIAHLYEKVGDCHTVTVAEANVAVAMGAR